MKQEKEDYKLDKKTKLIFITLLIWLLTFVIITIFADTKKAGLISTFMIVFFWIMQGIIGPKKK
jgi:uncharacterized membrane protein